jgi:FKBP-type peptidyl-prolyl cis-trans isomerase (trigger factor)
MAPPPPPSAKLQARLDAEKERRKKQKKKKRGDDDSSTKHDFSLPQLLMEEDVDERLSSKSRRSGKSRKLQEPQQVIRLQLSLCLCNWFPL